MGMGWHYRRSYETVLVGQVPGAACKWYDETNAVENIIRPGQYGIKKIIPSKDDHPTPKPPELAEHLIRLHSQRDELVLDPFAGAGWVAVAAVRNERKFVGVEIEPRWFAKMVEKIEAELRRTPLLDEPVAIQRSLLDAA